MVLAGKLSTELEIKTPADKFYNLIASQLHQVQNFCERVHQTKLHQGDDWHCSDSVKHWTYVIDGKVQTCYESVTTIDEQNKRNTYKFFGGDIDEHYKDFKLIFEIIDKVDGYAIAKWTIEYEKISEEIDPPNGYIEYFNKSTREIDAHLFKA